MVREGTNTENTVSLVGNVVGAMMPFTTGVGTAARSGLRLAKSGEALEASARQFAGLQKNTLRVLEGEANGVAYRIPDMLSKRMLAEVKDTLTAAATRQLTDLLKVARDEGLQFSLFISDRTKLTRPLVQLIGDQKKARIFRRIDGEWRDVTMLELAKLGGG